ncbi:phosphate ABC transporter substrate-binding protein [Bradyrhizobium sp. LHD-71]|uniref:phosphate ABC transporter substrate-binding protein n=1 Tax=Bradyrhizobium sp. LHD-71 TaxID=3072141 RepID=UPI00280CFFF2|nr:phosphate ABC transporter substrate-binding protein [Bradyrhizobium sp. LHD-71]MDQ8726621.1 phosphate ABC transporter substrate-binding protein [Bradyrhizobium sp. LHD-71]
MASPISRTIALAAFVVLAAVAALFFFLRERQAATGATGSVQVAGSETMRPVVSACAEEFMSRNPKADVIVKGGGSGDGVAAVLHGIADIGMASRDLSQRERDYAASKGIELSEFALARDGVTIIVNRASPIDALDLEQLQAIFAGSIRNWRELGGEDLEITAFARAAGSGTASLFGDRVLKDAAYAPSVTQLPTNEAIVAEVGARAGAIGYTSLGALRSARNGVKSIALRVDEQLQAATPTAEQVRSQRYPLARTLHLIGPRRSTDTASAFVAFCLSPAGQSLVRKAGYVSITQDGE